MPEAKTDQRAAPPRFEDLLARAEALIPVLRERAPRAEQLRRLPDETIADLHAAGLFRMLQPTRVGGSELSFRAICELTAVIGQGCGSTAWVLANLAAHHWLLGMWHPEAQDEIRGESPDSLISSALIFARGRAQRVEGGYRLSGRWPYSSGVDPSGWNIFGAVVSDEETGQSEPRMFLVPASDYTIIDTWQVIGLAGTGSKDVEVADAFVPAYRTLATERIKGGPNRGSELNPGTLYKLPAVPSSISPRRPATGSAPIPARTSPILPIFRSISRRRRRWPMPRKRSCCAIATRRRGSPRPGSCPASSSGRATAATGPLPRPCAPR